MTSPAPDLTHQNAYCTLVNSLQSAGVWNKLTFLELTAAHSPQAARLNAIHPSSPCTEAGTTTDLIYVTDRYLQEASGIGGYLVCMASAFTTTTTGDGSTVVGAANIAIGSYAIGNGAFAGNTASNTIARQSTGINYNVGLNNASATIDTSTIVGGVSIRHVVTSRVNDAANFVYYVNNSAGTSVANAANGTVSNSEFRVLSAGGTRTSGTQLMVLHVGVGLTSTEVTALHNALATYLTTIGAI